MGILFVFACLNRRIGTPVVKEPSLVASTPLKRRHSHEEKSICLDEHHVQELKSVKRRRSLDRKLNQDKACSETTWTQFQRELFFF